MMRYVLQIDRHMNERDWLILAQAYVNVAEAAGLLEQFGDVGTIVGQGESALAAAGLGEKKARAITAPDTDLLERTLRWLDAEDHCVLVHGSAEYPELLGQISGAPLLLYVNGKVEALHLPALAVVGSRNPTRGGSRNSLEFARYLAAAGCAIVSGLAEGIDTAAHRGALSVDGMTVAVLGHGIDRVYPARNHGLAHEIATSGALVTEYPPGAPPDRRHFPERNRIISGLALGTLVVEAARRSGSLITARLAAEQGREVFALPGSIHNPLSRGCHELIRQGAKLVETAADIGAELAPLAGHMQLAAAGSGTIHATSDPAGEDETEVDNEYRALRRCLSHDPASIDDLEAQSGLTIDQLSSMLLLMELHGEVESLSGGRYALIA